MGRLHHLKESLPVIMSQPNSEVIVVDYSCPDGSGRWAKKNYPDSHVVEVKDEEYFSLTKARNAAIPVIKEMGCNWLCFVDADTIIAENFTEKILIQTFSKNKTEKVVFFRPITETLRNGLFYLLSSASLHKTFCE